MVWPFEPWWVAIGYYPELDRRCFTYWGARRLAQRVYPYGGWLILRHP